jgi:hypothetical protein
MEGSRHERAALVIAAYVIGFTSAFIIYASVQTNSVNDVFINMPAASNPAAVIESQSQTEEPVVENTAPAAVEKDVRLTYEKGLLEITINNESHLLSFNPEITGFDADFDSLSQGFHFGEIEYKASDDDRFVFFCERHDADDEACNGYVYELDTNVIHQITQEGEPVFVSKASVAKVNWTEGGLEIGKSFSANENVPWILINEDTPIDLQ